LYLILPQTQGAKILYQEHVHPFLQKNELAIDEFISSAHDRAKVAGLTYLKQGIELIKQYVLGLPPKEPTPPPTPSPYSYAQSLISRFNLPAARPAFPSNSIGGATNTATDFYALLASAVGAATSSSLPSASDSRSRDLSNSGTLIPPTVQGEDRLSFIAAQRERLSILLSALDKEASTLQSQTVKSSGPRKMSSTLFDGRSDEEIIDRPKSAMSSRKSEPDFENIDAESGTEEGGQRKGAGTSGGSWMPWSWGAKTEAASDVDTVMSETPKAADKGKSSGVEL
jgi:hypothetical protein